MSDASTHRVEVTGIPVQSIRLEILDGPDAETGAPARGERLTVGTASDNDVVLTDRTASRYHVELTRCHEGVRVEDLGSTNGTFSGGVRIERGIVNPDSMLTLGRTRVRVCDGETLQAEMHVSSSLGGLHGRSPDMRRLMARVQRAAMSDAAVLIVGESGTGKELIARALHEHGRRVGCPFVTVDCASLSPTLVASELFGHEKGAFTGADRAHAGAFERAHGGTLFLDEIGELPQTLQPNLLGAIERRRFLRLGGRSEISVDARVVSATHRDLRTEVNAGTFRLDLYYRVAVVVLQVPPLRERPEDIALLVEHFLREAGYTGPVEDIVSSTALATLSSSHRWPGNVRELRNLVEAALAMGEAPALLMELDDGSASPLGTPTTAESGDDQAVLSMPYKEARGQVLHDFESRYLRALVERTRWNMSRAAREAHMDRSYLRDLLRRHGMQ